MQRRLTGLILCLIILAGCSTGGQSSQTPTAATILDPMGNEITLPDSVERIVAMGPSITETLVSLGLADKIVAVDEYSAYIPGLPEGIPLFDMMHVDSERLIALEPDIILPTGMSLVQGESPYKTLEDAGACVAYIPVADSIEEIKQCISFLGEVTGTAAEAEAIIADMEREIAAISAIGKTIDIKKTVYFEIYNTPQLYSFGSGVYLDEMLSIIGATNVLGDRESWLSVAEEVVVLANPDVILTNVQIDDPVGDITSRPGWAQVSAVISGDVHVIDNKSSSQPNEGIVRALKEMALAIYPEEYSALS